MNILNRIRTKDLQNLSQNRNVSEAARVRHRGLGRALATAARHLVPPGHWVWSQQAAGNARSVRAFQAAGYRPVGAEALLIAH